MQYHFHDSLTSWIKHTSTSHRSFLYSKMKPKIENQSSDTTDKKEWKKDCSPVKYNNKLKDGNRQEKRKCTVKIGKKLKKGEWGGSARRILGLWPKSYKISSHLGNWVHRCPEKGIVCVGCTMRFQGVHRIVPKSGWFLSFGCFGCHRGWVG